MLRSTQRRSSSTRHFADYVDPGGEGRGKRDQATGLQDRRRTIVALTAKGQDQAQRLLDVRPIFVAAYRQLTLETDADIFDALRRIEAALIEKPFAKRLTV